jgi:hypothetical protein
VSLPPGAAVSWLVPDGCGWLAFDAGRERGTGGVGSIEVVIDSVVVRRVPVPARGATRVGLEACGPSLSLRADGDGRFRGVVGNPRLYLPTR